MAAMTSFHTDKCCRLVNAHAASAARLCSSALIYSTFVYIHCTQSVTPYCRRIIIGSDRQPETKQGIEGKIVRFRSGMVRDRVRVRDKDRLSEPDRRSEPNTVSRRMLIHRVRKKEANSFL